MVDCHLMPPKGRKIGFEKAHIEFSDLIHVVQGDVGAPAITEGFL